MKSLLIKTVLAGLPLVGILLAAPPVALAKHHHHWWHRYGYNYPPPPSQGAYYYRGAPSYRYGMQPYYGGSPYASPYYGSSPYASPYAPGPGSLLPSLLGLFRPY
jgi:hypothetical protein